MASVQDRRAVRARMERLPGQQAVLDHGGLEEREGKALLVFAQHVEREPPVALDDGVRAGIGFNADDHKRR
jgi:hypothetical protein